MKTHYFSNFRRGAQTALSLVLGGMFLILGTVELLYLNKIWGAVFVAVGALVVLVPQFIPPCWLHVQRGCHSRE